LSRAVMKTGLAPRRLEPLPGSWEAIFQAALQGPGVPPHSMG
jgi:hypothetical protein